MFILCYFCLRISYVMYTLCSVKDGNQISVDMLWQFFFQKYDLSVTRFSIICFGGLGLKSEKCSLAFSLSWS